MENFPSLADSAAWHTDFGNRLRALSGWNLKWARYDDTLPGYGSGWPTNSQWIAAADACDIINMQCFGPSVAAVIGKEQVHGGDPTYPDYGSYDQGNWWTTYGMGRAQFLQNRGKPFTIGIEISMSNLEQLQYTSFANLCSMIAQLDNHYKGFSMYYGLTIECTLNWGTVMTNWLNSGAVAPEPPVVGQ